MKERIFHCFVVLCNSFFDFSSFLDRFVIFRIRAKGVHVLANGDVCNVSAVRVGWGKSRLENKFIVIVNMLQMAYIYIFIKVIVGKSY